jgi:hypothetical protein
VCLGQSSLPPSHPWHLDVIKENIQYQATATRHLNDAVLRSGAMSSYLQQQIRDDGSPTWSTLRLTASADSDLLMVMR